MSDSNVFHVAPCLVFRNGQWWITEELFTTEQEAMDYAKSDFVCWPAPVMQRDGFYQVQWNWLRGVS